MRNIIIGLISLITLINCGCRLQNNPSTHNYDCQQLHNDIYYLTSITTRIIIAESDWSFEDKESLKTHLITIKQFLTLDNNPDFDFVRNIIMDSFPLQYQFYGLSIVDVIERYTRTIDINLTERQQCIIDLIIRAIDGAMDGLNV